MVELIAAFAGSLLALFLVQKVSNQLTKKQSLIIIGASLFIALVFNLVNRLLGLQLALSIATLLLLLSNFLISRFLQVEEENARVPQAPMLKKSQPVKEAVSEDNVKVESSLNSGVGEMSQNTIDDYIRMITEAKSKDFVSMNTQVEKVADEQNQAAHLVDEKSEIVMESKFNLDLDDVAKPVSHDAEDVGAHDGKNTTFESEESITAMLEDFQGVDNHLVNANEENEPTEPVAESVEQMLSDIEIKDEDVKVIENKPQRSASIEEQLADIGFEEDVKEEQPSNKSKQDEVEIDSQLFDFGEPTQEREQSSKEDGTDDLEEILRTRVVQDEAGDSIDNKIVEKINKTDPIHMIHDKEDDDDLIKKRRAIFAELEKDMF